MSLVPGLVLTPVGTALDKEGGMHRLADWLRACHVQSVARLPSLFSKCSPSGLAVAASPSINNAH